MRAHHPRRPSRPSHPRRPSHPSRPGRRRRAGSVLLLLVLPLLLTGCAAPGAQQSPAQPSESQPGPEQSPWAWEMPRCAAFQPADYPSAEHRTAAGGPGPERSGTTVEVYRPGWGERAVAEIRAVVRACGSYEDGDQREQHLVVDAGFAADDSLLVETVQMAPPDPPETFHTMVIRHGDVLVTVRSAGLGPAQLRCLAGPDEATCDAGQRGAAAPR